MVYLGSGNKARKTFKSLFSIHWNPKGTVQEDLSNIISKRINFKACVSKLLFT